jgi:purine nucleosidase
MTAKPLIIDCDPGVDDAIALLLALASPDDLALRGITTVAGNVPLALTQYNARRVCRLARRTNVPVFAGCPRPLLQPLVTAEAVHGETGLDGASLPEPDTAMQAQHAVSFLIEQLTAADDPVTLAMLGPLTNLAVALVQAPALRAAIDRVVVMGGALGQGNVTPAAEFNMYVDPHAARIVFEADLPITLIGLEVTHQVVSTAERIQAFERLGTPVGKAVADLLRHYGQLDAERYGLAAAPLHDPCVIAYLLQPQLFTGRAMAVAMETCDPSRLGRTALSAPTATHPAHLTWLETVNAEGVYRLLTDRLAKL